MSPHRRAYATDLTDAQWKRIAPLLPKESRTGRPRTVPYREIVNAVLYVVRTGCAWRHLPHDLPYWKTVYTYFRRWRLEGLWEKLHERLRDETPLAAGRERSPSAAILDSQSVKTTEKGGAAAATTRARR